MKTSTKIISVALAALITSQAQAAGDRGERFKEADTDGNGVVTYDEMMGKVKTKFSEFDKNGDGYLELAELPKEMPIPERMEKRMKRHQERMEERAEKAGRDFDADDMGGKWKPTRIKFIAKHDRDGDEKVSVDEFATRMVHHFKRMDVNGNGEVTQDEAKEAMKKMKKRFGKKGKGHGDRGSRR
ncbi:EF-hand domain-containing protein [Kordiimonas sp.]|uniref:EF-hand domain-containing protein n=1 Tax=Kordiimonas sp. TaxID=1970157 RepID=UPI003A8D4856